MAKGRVLGSILYNDYGLSAMRHLFICLLLDCNSTPCLILHPLESQQHVKRLGDKGLMLKSYFDIPLLIITIHQIAAQK